MRVTEKSDVYSFGVVALEVILGQYPGELICTLLSLGGQNILLADVLDHRLPHPNADETKQIMWIVTLALACLRASPQSWPTMLYVSQGLSAARSRLVNPFHTITLSQLKEFKM